LCIKHGDENSSLAALSGSFVPTGAQECKADYLRSIMGTHVGTMSPYIYENLVLHKFDIA